MKNSFKKNLYTIILWYKNNTFIYQVFAKNQIEAQLKWLQIINLKEIGVVNFSGIQEELISDARSEIFFPVLINQFQNVWNTTVTRLSHEDGVRKDYPISYIIATLDSNKNIKMDHKKFQNKLNLSLLQHSMNKFLYTIQLVYKGNIYVEQLYLSGNCTCAKIKWISQLNLNVISGAPNENIEQIKNSILLQQNEPSFIPQELKEFDSVWSTNIQLGDEVGRVTIVATKSCIL